MIRSKVETMMTVDQIKLNVLIASERLQIFQWLSSVKYQDHHPAKAKTLLDGSCQRLFEKPEF
jgi:hypothetical protein